ncbi:hypothetical protein LOC68_22020 [Blastopirellula sp. JC732]|uniref:Uncharacterized protein n=1 Tax=Blastopirellula sediminis TaxID=2894196 RepID=A0A9X1SI19_9BACT|nr:hypothetical protein [Blastopirellula sediminis]MCC9605622.1 hypothetical protein [Blastopirellula sediminis]MCC9631078.1 hypothetical protein [Blastopirellula sediminis]
MRTAILSLLAALLASGTVNAQSLFPNLYRITPDANMLQQSAAKLGAELTSADQTELASAANALAAMMERYRQDAGRNANPYYLQRRFSDVSAAYKELELELDSRLPEPRPYVIRIAWQDLQKSYDQLYYNLFGYDTVDPYFGRHADFAATPPFDYFQPSIQRRTYIYSTPLIYNRVIQRETTPIAPRIIPPRTAPVNPAPIVRPQPQPFDLDPSTKALDL